MSPRQLALACNVAADACISHTPICTGAWHNVWRTEWNWRGLPCTSCVARLQR